MLSIIKLCSSLYNKSSRIWKKRLFYFYFSCSKVSTIFHLCSLMFVIVFFFFLSLSLLTSLSQFTDMNKMLVKYKWKIDKSIREICKWEGVLRAWDWRESEIGNVSSLRNMIMRKIKENLNETWRWKWKRGKLRPKKLFRFEWKTTIETSLLENFFWQLWLLQRWNFMFVKIVSETVGKNLRATF